MFRTSKKQPCLPNATGGVYDFCHSFKHLSSMWGHQGQPGWPQAKVSLLKSEHPVHLLLRQVWIPHCCCCKDCTTVQKGIKRLAGLYRSRGGNWFSCIIWLLGFMQRLWQIKLINSHEESLLCFYFFETCGARFLRECSCGVINRLFSFADAAVPARGGAFGPCDCPAVVELQLCAPCRGSSRGRWRFLVVVT